MQPSDRLKAQALPLYQKFLKLHKEDKIPPKVSQKLLFLSESFVEPHLQYNSHVVFISPEQKQSLSEMPASTKIQMFIQIAQCLISQEQEENYLIREEKAWIRKYESNVFWVRCRVSVSKQKIVLFNEKSKQVLKQIVVKSVALNDQVKQLQKVQGKYLFGDLKQMVCLSVCYKCLKRAHFLFKIALTFNSVSTFVNSDLLFLKINIKRTNQSFEPQFECDCVFNESLLFRLFSVERISNQQAITCQEMFVK